MRPKRLTIPNGKMHPAHKQTYRAPAYDEEKKMIDHNCFFGQIVNKLGQYEDIGTVEEFKELKKRNKQ